VLCILKILKGVVKKMHPLILNIFDTFFSVLVLLISVINLTFITKPNKNIFITYALTLSIIIICITVTNISYLGAPSMFISIFIYFFILYKKVIISLVISAFIGIFIFVCDAVTWVLFFNIFNINYLSMRANFLLYFIAEIFMVLNTYIISKFVRIIILRIINKINKIEVKFEFPKPVKILFVISIIITIIIFSAYVAFSRITMRTNDGYLFSFYAFYLLLFFMFAVAVIYYGFSMLINYHRYKEYLQLKDYTNMIENMYSDLRSFKHDYLNILSTLETYIEKQDINGLKIFYYNELLPESNIIISKDISLSLLSHIKISPLKALLSSKFTTAHSHGIKVSIELIDDIEHVNMSTIDICRIIGILLDNAIEASVLCDNKFIHFAMVKTDNQTILNISNSCLSSTPPIHKLYTKNFSTKGENRGIGLNNIKDIINKRYNNVLFNTSIDNCVFKQELIINNK